MIAGMDSVVSLLDEAEVPVRRATVREIEYVVDGRLHSAVIHRFAQLPANLPEPPVNSRMLLFCAAASKRARDRALNRSDVDLVVEHPREVVLAGRHIVTPRVDHRPRRRPYTIGAIIRMVILADHPLKQREIGDALMVSQQAVSRALSQVDYLEPGECPLSRAERAQLLERWIIPAPISGEVSHWYTLDSPREAVGAIAALAADLEVGAFAAGELAAEHYRPWRVPNSALIYADELFDLTDAGVSRALPAEANVTLQVPQDPTILATARWWCDQRPGGPQVRCFADPVIALQDLATRSEYDDGAEGQLRDWIISR